MGQCEPVSGHVELVSAWTAVRQVLTSPTLGFFRLAEGGSLLPPLMLVTLSGLVGSGMGPLKAILIAALGPGRNDPVWLTWALVALLALAPLYYAALVAVYSLFGTLIAGRSAGVSYRAAFRRVWSTVGWINLPLVLITATIIGWMLTAGRAAGGPLLAEMAAAWRSGLVPSYTVSLGIVGLAVLVWTGGLLVIAVRQALATDTPRAVAIIAATGVAFGLLVHTPLAHLVLATVPDPERALGRGPAAIVSRLAYAGPWGGVPQVGEVVAVATTLSDGSRLAIPAGPGLTIGAGRLMARLGRIVAGPGDEAAIVDGRLHVNGLEVPEPYLEHLPGVRAYPEGLTLDPVVVPPGSYLILPDDRSTLRRGLDRAVAKESAILGQVVGLHVDGSAAPASEAAVTAGTTTVTVRDGPSEPGTLSPTWHAVFRYPGLRDIPSSRAAGWWYAADPVSGNVAVLLDYAEHTGTGPAVLVGPSGASTELGTTGLPCSVTATNQAVALMTRSARDAAPYTSHTAVVWLVSDETGAGAEAAPASRYRATFHGVFSPAVGVGMALDPSGGGLVYNTHGKVDPGAETTTHWLVRVDAGGDERRAERQAWTVWAVDWPTGLILEVEPQVDRSLARLVSFADLEALDELELPGAPLGASPGSPATDRGSLNGFAGPDRHPGWWVQTRGVVSLVSVEAAGPTVGISAVTVTRGGGQAWPSPDGWCVVTTADGATLYSPTGRRAWVRTGSRAVAAATAAGGGSSLIVFEAGAADRFRVELVGGEGQTRYSREFTATHRPGPLVSLLDTARGVVFWKDGPSDRGGRVLTLLIQPGGPGEPRVQDAEFGVLLPERTQGGRLVAGGRFLMVEAAGSMPGSITRSDTVIHFFDLSEAFRDEFWNNP